jgi:hypothetical protein
MVDMQQVGLQPSATTEALLQGPASEGGAVSSPAAAAASAAAAAAQQTSATGAEMSARTAATAMNGEAPRMCGAQEEASAHTTSSAGSKRASGQALPSQQPKKRGRPPGSKNAKGTKGSGGVNCPKRRLASSGLAACSPP